MIANTFKHKERGFTIVELLVVIVVIGILATITIVSYTGITQKANTTKALSNAQSAQNVAEVFAAEFNYYPSTSADFQASSTTKLPAGIYIVLSGGTGNNAPLSNTNGMSTIQYDYCGAVAAPAANAVTGARIQYWDFGKSGGAGLSTNVIYLGTGTSAGGAGAAPCWAWVVPTA